MNAENKENENCNAWIDRAIHRDVAIKTLFRVLTESGCNIPREKIISETCDANVRGGFDRERGIVLCQNHIQSQSQVNFVLAHELVHAFDECRSKIVWENCEHHACSEIRASNLSGECDFMKELARRQIGGIGKHHQDCVKRRALASLAYNPNCNGAVNAKEAIDKVFTTCFRDIRPFSKIP